jgi:O-acetylhomoserine/O-acetylserine sulfhydrylase-like pyridoxal-dependent enzyme
MKLETIAIHGGYQFGPTIKAKVEWVRYAGLSDHPDFSLVKKYCNGKAAGVLSFGIIRWA